MNLQIYEVFGVWKGLENQRLRLIFGSWENETNGRFGFIFDCLEVGADQRSR
jgi:hypothetical protein